MSETTCSDMQSGIKRSSISGILGFCSLTEKEQKRIHVCQSVSEERRNQREREGESVCVCVSRQNSREREGSVERTIPVWI